MSVLPPYRTTVIADWIDYNGHLSEAYYVLVFGFATDAVLDQIGLGPAEREATGSSLYTVEAHLRYLREVGEGAELTVTSRIVGSRPKSVHLAHTMNTVSGVVATEELLCLHVTGTPAATAPLPPAVSARVTDLEEPAPDWVGRSLGR